jgi:large subunit ribosomal protein L21
MYPQLPRTWALGYKISLEESRSVRWSEAWRLVFMKYAIFEDGGKQYKAVEGSTIDVDRYQADVGDQIDLERVLLITDGEQTTVGTPYVKGAKVEATVVSQVKGKKIVVFKYKPRVRYRVKSGHRQKYTRLKIDSIVTK